MKAIKIAGAVLLMAACINGYAQGPGTAAPASVAASASAATSPASGAVTDRQLAASVRKALHAARRNGLKSSFIRVRANGGVLTLTGVVADNSQIGFATSVAQGVPGVTSVVNKLTLRSVAGMKGSE